MANVENQDLYEALGVKPDASQDEIRKAYRELARKYHPDKTGGDKAAEEKLKTINAAYDILKNAEKRKEYDQQRAYRGGFGGFEGFGFSGGPGGAEDFADVFSSMFGARGAGAGTRGRPRGRAGARQPHAGHNLESTVRVSLRDVVSGTKRKLRLRRGEKCSECDGTGAAPGSKPVTCPDCGGVGEIQSGNGFFQMTQTCPRCRGLGSTIANPCMKCGGSGRRPAERELNVDIPAGVESGTRLRLAGEGEAGLFGGPRGDLYVRVEVEPDPFFKREGSNITCEVPVTIVEATLGAKIKVPTLEGTAQVTVPPGTQSGSTLRMRKMGLPHFRRTGRGDQLVNIVVEVPKKVSKEQQEILKQFDKRVQPGSYPKKEKFITRLGS